MSLYGLGRGYAFKRKLNGYKGTLVRGARRAKKRKIMRFRRGYDRTGGYYGRYNTRGRRSYKGGELKFHDLDTVDAVVAATGSIDVPSCNLIAQGTTESTRIGRKCTIRKILWKFDCKLPASTSSTATSDVLQVILYLDKQANGVTAAVLDILETAAVNEFRNLSNSGRFRILMNRHYSLTAPSGGGDGTTEDYGEYVIHDEYYKECNIPLEFSGITGAITELRSNNIGILLISKDGTANFNGKMRVRFSDSG